MSTLTVIVFKNRASDWLTSLANLGMTVGVSVINHRYGGGSTWIDALCVVLGFVVLFATANRRLKTSWRGSIDDAIEHLEQMRNDIGKG